MKPNKIYGFKTLIGNGIFTEKQWVELYNDMDWINAVELQDEYHFAQIGVVRKPRPGRYQ